MEQLKLSPDPKISQEEYLSSSHSGLKLFGFSCITALKGLRENSNLLILPKLQLGGKRHLSASVNRFSG
jgi:hypothetical protein